MFSGLTSLFTPRSKANQPPPPASDASRNAIPLPEVSQPLVTPVQQEDEGSDAEDEEAEEDTPQPKRVDAKNYESPTIAKVRRLSDEHTRPITSDEPASTGIEAPLGARDPSVTRAITKEVDKPSQTRSTARSTREKRTTAVKPVTDEGVPGMSASAVVAKGRKRQREMVPEPLVEAPKKRRRGSAKGPHQLAPVPDNDSPPYEASTTIDNHGYSAHVSSSHPGVPAWEELPRTHHIKQDGHTYREGQVVNIAVGEGEEMQEEALGLVLEIRDEYALVAWYYTPEDTKAEKRPTTWVKDEKTHIISSHVDVISLGALYNSPLSAKQRLHLVEDKVLNLVDPNGRTPRLTNDTKACMLARALR